jgi:hypothetical protein
MFEVGDLVVCVDDQPKKGQIRALVPIHHLIKRGHVYRVDYVGRAPSSGKVTVGLEGVSLPAPMVGFAPYRFRKIRPSDNEFSRLLARSVGRFKRELEPV